MFYVYEWYNIQTGFIFYVGKGKGKRYNSKQGRNQLFKNYLESNNCDVRIVKTFDSESKALEFEHDRILEYKCKSQCVCNLDNGGTGGTCFVWTDEMRQYKSEYNPMKSEKNRTKMSKCNPMKNKNVSSKVALSKSRPVIIKGVRFESTKSAGEHFGKHPEQIQNWCKRGYDSDKIKCCYAGEEYKQFEIKVTNSIPVVLDNVEFDSIAKAAQYIGVWSESLIRAIKSNRPCKGHTCRYGNQQPSLEKSN